MDNDRHCPGLVFRYYIAKLMIFFKKKLSILKEID